jgi:cell wall assembly regulator SMI1
MPVSDDTDELPELLERLEGVWRREGGDYVEHLRPGLSPDAVAAQTDPLGLVLPRSAVIWFGWHDGTDRHSGIRGLAIGGSGYSFLTLADACHEYETRVLQAQQFAEMDEITPAQAGWDPSWFPLMQSTGGSTVGIDCSSVPGQPAPLRTVHKADSDPEGIDAPSLAAVVRFWLDLHAWGALRYEPRFLWWQHTGTFEVWGPILGHDLPSWLRRWDDF